MRRYSQTALGLAVCDPFWRCMRLMSKATEVLTLLRFTCTNEHPREVRIYCVADVVSPYRGRSTITPDAFSTHVRYSCGAPCDRAVSIAAFSPLARLSTHTAAAARRVTIPTAIYC